MLATILSSKCSPAPTTYACIQCTRWQNARRLRARTHDCILCSMMSLLKCLSLQSGKSVYLKQVALIVYLAHLGSWVPAHSCQVSCLFWIGIRCLPPRARFAHDAQSDVLHTKVRKLSNSLAETCTEAVQMTALLTDNELAVRGPASPGALLTVCTRGTYEQRYFTGQSELKILSCAWPSPILTRPNGGQEVLLGAKRESHSVRAAR